MLTVVREVRTIAAGAGDEAAALPSETETGPLLTRVTAGCER